MSGIRVRTNAGTLAGLLLLVVGGVMMVLSDPQETGRWTTRNIALGILIAATVSYLGGRIAMLLKGSRRP